MTTNELLDEAYLRLHGKGPEFGGDEEGNHGLTNHGPMAVEVMVRRGLDVDVHHWLDGYLGKLTDLPGSVAPIAREDWRPALGDHRRVGDWTTFFSTELAERPWRDVLGEWWPRLLPGIVAGSTHGVIRVGHAVRALRASDSDRIAATELAYGLAFWAARWRVLPGVTALSGNLRAGDALTGIPRLADQTGVIAHRIGRLADLPGWPAAVAAVAPAADPDDVPDRLADLMTEGVLRYRTHGAASPVLLVHTATAPNAVRQVLPVLPKDVWPESFAAVWAACAAITSAYAPAAPLPFTGHAPTDSDPVGEVFDRAARHGDEHVIKFADTAVDVFDRTGNPDALAAALHAAEVIGAG